MKYFIWFFFYFLFIFLLGVFDFPFPVFINIFIFFFIVILIPISLYLIFFKIKNNLFIYFICVFFAYYLFYIGTSIITEKYLDMKITEFAQEEYQYELLTPEQKSMIDYQIGDGGRKTFFLYFGWIPPIILSLISCMFVKIIKFLYKKT